MRLCIIAGSGNLPKNIVDAVKNPTEDSQSEIYVICIKDFAQEKDFLGCKSIITVKLGEVGKTLQFLKDNDITHVLFAGKVVRPSLRNIKADIAGVKLLTRLLKCKILGDDQLLKEVINYIEEQGFKVISSNDILENKISLGALTKMIPSESQLEDIKIGAYALNFISSLDVGQAIIVAEKRIIAIEAAEGTDELIKRSANYLQNESRVLVKLAKLNQDLRVDLPAIGEETIINAKKSKIAGIAIDSSKIVVINQEQTIAKANELGIFIYVINGENYVD